jgi:outer membrane immunogenic protein
MKKLTTATAVLALTGSAHAADLYVTAPPPVWDWTGFYIGGTLGGTTLNAKDGWTIDPAHSADAPGAIAAREALSAQTLRSTSLYGGPEIGYNKQIGFAVVGIEGDWSWGNASNTSFTPTLAPLFGFPGDGNNLTQAANLNWIATVRGRIGVAWNQVLFYGTGGFAAGDVRVFDSSHYAAGVTETAEASKILNGWAAGGGIEWAFSGNWTVKGEYLHVDLGDLTTTSTLLPAFNVSYSHNHHITADIARAGINYKF